MDWTFDFRSAAYGAVSGRYIDIFNIYTDMNNVATKGAGGPGGFWDGDTFNVTSLYIKTAEDRSSWKKYDTGREVLIFNEFTNSTTDERVITHYGYNTTTGAMMTSVDGTNFTPTSDFNWNFYKNNYCFSRDYIDKNWTEAAGENIYTHIAGEGFPSSLGTYINVPLLKCTDYHGKIKFKWWVTDTELRQSGVGTGAGHGPQDCPCYLFFRDGSTGITTDITSKYAKLLNETFSADTWKESSVIDMKLNDAILFGIKPVHQGEWPVTTARLMMSYEIIE